MLALPVVSVVSIIRSRIYMSMNDYKNAVFAYVWPGINIAVIVHCFLLIEIFCAGSFSCH